jgi:putative acetyltransferase
MSELIIAVDDPRRADFRDLIDRHLAFARVHSRPEDVHALDTDALLDPAITVFGARVDGELLAIGAIRELGEDHGELKSMHTAEAARGRGIGEQMALRLIDEGRRRGYTRLSLETGTADAFVAARALYAKVGFEPCGAFGDHEERAGSTFLTLRLGPN